MMSEVLRKIIHMVFSFLLLTPILIRDFLSPVVSYGILLLVAGWIYSVQVRGPPEWLNTFPLKQQIKGVDYILDQFNRYVSMVERDYEKRAGWLGVLAGIIGAVSSYLIFPETSFYGITSLALVDGFSSLVGKPLGRTRLPLTDGTLEGTLAGLLAYLTFLLLIGTPFISSLTISLAGVVAELYGGEDNVSIPVFTSAVAGLLHLSSPI